MNPAESQERDFHDQQAAGIDPADELVGPSFAPVGAPENAQVLERLGSLQGRRVLDLGCGTGTAGAHLAALGARVICVDVSAGMLGVARRVAQGQGGRVQPVVGSAHRLPFASSSMDVVYGYGLLHHVDIEQALAEVARVLRPAGRALFIDPLAYNPLIKAYRRMSRAVHSRHERPLRRADLRAARRHFRSVRHDEYWLAAQAVFLWYYLVERRDPGRERYWKLVIRDGERLSWLVEPLHRLDRRLLARLPGLGLLCWNVLLDLSEPIKAG